MHQERKARAKNPTHTSAHSLPHFLLLPFLVSAMQSAAEATHTNLSPQINVLSWLGQCFASPDLHVGYTVCQGMMSLLRQQVPFFFQGVLPPPKRLTLWARMLFSSSRPINSTPRVLVPFLAYKNSQEDWEASQTLPYILILHTRKTWPAMPLASVMLFLRCGRDTKASCFSSGAMVCRL